MSSGRRARIETRARVSISSAPVFKWLACLTFMLVATESAQAFGPLGIVFRANDNTSLSFPPDTHCAAGPQSVIGVVNCNMEIFDKQGQSIFQTELQAFFEDLQDQNDIEWTFLSDPKIIFDQYLQKFIVIILALDTGMGGGGGISDSFLLIGVSTTPNPTGDQVVGDQRDWLKYSINTATSTHWSDYPGFGIDEDTIYVTYNMFPKMTGGVLTRKHLISKNGLQDPINPPPLLTNNFIENVANGEGNVASTLQPAHSFGDTQTEWFASISNSFGSSDRVFVNTRDGGFSPNNTRTFVVDVPQYSPGGAGRQRNTSTLLDTLSDRVINSVWRDNSLWFAHTIQGPSGTAIRWYEIDTTDFPTDPFLAQSGDVTMGPNGVGTQIDNFIPAIMVNQAGDMLVSYSCAGPNNFPSVCYAHRLKSTTDDPGETELPTLVVPGQNEYEGFGFGFERWGDYAGNALDPTDQATFWMFHETAAPNIPTTWTTWFGSATLTGGGGGTGPPPLPTPSTLFLTRPNEFRNFVTGTTERISWAFTGNGNAPIKLLLFRNNILVGEIASSLPANTLNFDWTVGELTSGVTIPPGDTYVVRVAAVNNPAIFDASAAFFRITQMVEIEAGVFDGFGLIQDTAVFGPGQAVQLNAVATKGLAPYFFKWTPQDFLNNPNIAGPEARPLRNTTYNVEVRDSTGNTASTSVQLVQGNPLTVDAGQTQSFPAGGSVVLEGSVTGGSPPYVIEWFDCDPDSCVALPVSTSIQPVVSPPGLTAYFLRVTDTAGTIRTDNVLAEPGFTATFQNSPGNAGFVTRAPIKALYRFTEPIAFTATPNSGFVFDHWELDAAGTSNPTTISFPNRNITVRAVYRSTSATQGPLVGFPITLCGSGIAGGLMAGGLVLTLARLRRRRKR